MSNFTVVSGSDGANKRIVAPSSAASNPARTAAGWPVVKITCPLFYPIISINISGIEFESPVTTSAPNFGPTAGGFFYIRCNNAFSATGLGQGDVQDSRYTAANDKLLHLLNLINTILAPAKHRPAVQQKTLLHRSHFRNWKTP
jgi:hypothetical protein